MLRLASFRSLPAFNLIAGNRPVYRGALSFREIVVPRRQHSTTMPPYNPDQWKSVPAAGSRPAYSLFIPPIETSPQDDRSYRIIRLENGLEAVLVSDPKGDKAAASLDVAVGHLHDPVSTVDKLFTFTTEIGLG
jgi:hypothetical protein